MPPNTSLQAPFKVTRNTKANNSIPSEISRYTPPLFLHLIPSFEKMLLIKNINGKHLTAREQEQYSSDSNNFINAANEYPMKPKTAATITNEFKTSII